MTAEYQISRWMALVVIRNDGSEVCPLCATGDDLFHRKPKVSDIRIEENPYLMNLVREQGKISGYRLEELTWKEIADRGYRENPPL